MTFEYSERFERGQLLSIATEGGDLILEAVEYIPDEGPMLAIHPDSEIQTLSVKDWIRASAAVTGFYFPKMGSRDRAGIERAAWGAAKVTTLAEVWGDA